MRKAKKLIQTRNLTKIFQRTEKEGKKETVREFAAVDHVTMEARPGEILGILGPNGAGKTTLLRMMGCLMQPSSGEAVICRPGGEEIQSDTERKKQIGYLSGNTKLYRRFSIREILLLLGNIYGMSREETEKRTEEIIGLLSLQPFADNRIEKLSTGQTQRANIARCLIHSPQIYIFDEPTLGLDIISSEAILSFMKQERERGKTILYSTHYMEEAQYLCDRILMMDHGRVIAYAPTGELLQQTGTENLRDAFYAVLKNSAGTDAEMQPSGGGADAETQPAGGETDAESRPYNDAENSPKEESDLE